MNLLIRRAGTEDAFRLTSIALEAKRHWGYPEAWIALWTPALTITPAFIATHDVFASESNGRILGFYALVVGKGARWELDHLWVRPAHMGHGVGRQLFRHAARRLGDLAPSATLFIEADPNAESFYLRMGATRVGQIPRDWQGLTRVLPELEFSPRRLQTS
jgi:GNAT superfamily N-acetyltransferase